jgi:hypothetical protein
MLAAEWGIIERASIFRAIRLDHQVMSPPQSCVFFSLCSGWGLEKSAAR